MKVDDYRKVVKENATKTYRKAPENSEKEINEEASKIAIKLNIAEKVQKYSGNECFVTFKDHKENFHVKPECRLINPAKSEVGKISKQILEGIVTDLKEKSGLNLWKNNENVLGWFKNMEKGKKSKFVQFDIESFYPSISRDLLTKALIYAKTYVPVKESDSDIIYHSRKSLLFSESSSWVKKNGNMFDVKMGAYDGAEVCELVGLYLLSKIKGIIPHTQVGLYRDDGLAVIPRANGPLLEKKLKKRLYKGFNKDENLRVVVKTNMSRTNFLDIHLNLHTGEYRPFRKENNVPQYIHVESNKTKNIKKNLPAMIGNRLSGLSATQQIFENEKGPYEEALEKSGYNNTLTFQAPQPTHQKRKRHRNVLWYNPPFSESVSTNIGREFLNIIDRNFPQQHKYHKIFNRNTVKISYSCMPNIRNIIKGHNMSKLKTPETRDTEDASKCNCNDKGTCPLEGQCLADSLVYQATISCKENGSKKFRYIGITEGNFKARYNNHTASFRNRSNMSKTELSKKFWELKDKGKTPQISWEILKTVNKYKCGQEICNLCLTEKLLIIKSRDKYLLNSRSEIISKCRHKRKFLLIKV